jgi:hypothetical protein
MKKILFLVCLLVPFLAFADTYEDIGGASQMVADSFGGFWTFFFEDIPSAMTDFMKFIMDKVLQIKLYFMIHFVKAAWLIAKEMLESLQIMSVITANVSLLPQDVRQAIVDMRLFEGFNLIVQAYVTRFVMNQF